MAKGLTLKVRLPIDRTKTGTLTIVDPFTGGILYGPVAVLGRAARDTAKIKGNNPTGNALLPYGDTPLGKYKIEHILKNGPSTLRPYEQYGTSGAIRLTPTGGDALAAARTGILIHSGRHAFSSLLTAKVLKPTNGCIRMLDYQLKELIDVIRVQSLLFPGTVTIEVGPEGVQGDIDESVNDGDPPPLTGDILLP